MAPHIITLFVTLQVLDLNVDQTTGIVSTALGEALSGKEIKTRLKKLSDLQKVRGTIEHGWTIVRDH